MTPSTYSDAYLTCINPESNNYKYYWLRPSADAIHATYGRIGSERGEMFGTKELKNPYEPHLFWIRYYEKLSKGYIDQSDVYLSKKPSFKPKKKVNTDPNDVSAILYQKLLRYSRHPEEIANNIKKSGGNIAGIRAGSSTAEYLRKQMKYLIAIGSFCLCIIAIIPFIVSGLTGLSRLSFFGTSIIITVSVILETKKLILSKTQENYYMNRVKKGGLFRG